MTSTERLLGVVGAALCMGAAVLVLYVRASNPADAQSGGCFAARTALGRALDQLRFSRSADATLGNAVDFSSTTRFKYLHSVATARQQLAGSRLPPQALIVIHNQLTEADKILAEQAAPLARAHSILAQDRKELADSVPFVADASRDLYDGDCNALTVTVAQSGWPKDQPFNQLALAGNVNSGVSDKLDVALDLILHAQHAIRLYAKPAGKQ